MQQLWIHLPTDDSPEWAVLAQDGRVLEGPKPGWPDVTNLPVTLLLAAEQVLLLEAPRVAKSAAQLRRALPFAIEEQLAGPVEQAHFALSEDLSADSVAVAVIDRARLGGVLKELAARGLHPDACVAESQCLRASADASSWSDGHRLVLRQGRCAALVLDADAAPEVRAWLAAQGWTLPVEGAASARSWIELAQRGGDPLLPNLLQGDFAPPRRRNEALSGWRWAAVLAAAALLSALGAGAMELRALRQHVAERNAEMAQILRSTLPGTTRVVDPVAQLRAALGQSHARVDGLVWLGRIAPLLGGTQRLTLESVDYRGSVLELVVVAADVATLDGLREQVMALGGLEAELVAALPGSRGVEGRLRVTERGS